jgi:tetratricopeptide (TPR) repeat protein/thioredoxin-related protein
VSSTFSDLKEERNALQEKVFPKLKELCQQHGCRFQAIDLRWGVSVEAGLDQQTMKICLEEIARCQTVTPKPNFIILLGDRYGWQPLPYEIPTTEYEELLKYVTSEEKSSLNDWYKRDDNAVPPVYCLMPRVGEYRDYDKWTTEEKMLQGILQNAAHRLDLMPDKRLKYLASATELEIIQGALNIKNADQHVFGFFRTIHDLQGDSSAKDYIDMDNGHIDEEAARMLGELKKKLKRALTTNVHLYETRWTGNGPSYDHLPQLCEDVEKSLSNIILAEIAKLEKIDDLDNEMAAHEAFAANKAKLFIGRAGMLQRIGEYIAGDDKLPLAICGVSGSGKTALLAKAAQQAKNKNPDSVVIHRFIGATAGSSDIGTLLLSICRQISRTYGVDESTIPNEFQKLVDEFPARLRLATKDKPLVIFLDALDQLSDSGHAKDLIWLPRELPDNVHIIVSILPVGCYSTLEERLPAKSIVKLEPMPLEEGGELLDLWLDDSQRTLQVSQRGLVLNMFSANGLPLYLKLAFEEARLWKSFTSLSDSELKPDIPGIIDSMLDRLSADMNHGPVLVSKSLGYLAASRYGLSEDELLDVLSLDNAVLTDFKLRSPRSPDVERLPIIVWSRLYFDLEPYLMERNVTGVRLLSFYHRQLREAIEKKYLVSNEKAYHLSLADYFDKSPLRDRKVDEVPWQLSRASAWEQLVSRLVNPIIFISLASKSREYELMEYWRMLQGKYDMVEAFKPSLDLFCKEADPVLFSQYLDWVAHFFQMNARYDGAEPLLQRALDIMEKVKGPESPETARSLNSLGLLFYDKGDYAGAEPLYRRALNIREKILGLEHPDTASSLNNLALLLLDKGDNAGAEPLCRRALSINEKVFGLEHIQTALLLNSLAALLRHKGDYVEAEPLYRRALSIYEKVEGPEHPDTLKVLNNLAVMLKMKGDYARAEPLYRRALSITEKVFGPEHPVTAASLNNLAQLLYIMGDYRGSELLFWRVLSIYEKFKVTEYPETAKVLNNLAILLEKRGDYDEAENLFIRAISISEKTLGENHPTTITYMDNYTVLITMKARRNQGWKFW